MPNNTCTLKGNTNIGNYTTLERPWNEDEQDYKIQYEFSPIVVPLAAKIHFHDDQKLLL